MNYGRMIVAALLLVGLAHTASAQQRISSLVGEAELSKLPSHQAYNQAEYRRAVQAWTNAYAMQDGRDLPASGQPVHDADVSGNGPVAVAGAYDGCSGQGCTACAQGRPCGCCPCPWFFSVAGLYMTRDRGDHYYFSYDDTDESVQLSDPRDADMDWSGGFDVHFGRYFDCNRWGLEGVYWGLFPDAEQSSLVGGPLGGSLNGIFNWDDLDYDGANANSFVSAAQIHQLRRDWDIHNVEVNLLGNIGQGCMVGCGCSPWRFNWLAGVRYFRFTEDLQFASDTGDTVFTGAADELLYDIDIDNHLVGFQIGGNGYYCLSDRCSFVAGTKLGLFGNHISHYQRIGGSAGTATVNNGPNDTLAFYEDGHKNDVSFLAEVNLGLDYRINRCWSANVGYRAVAVTGVALPIDQIPSDLRGVNDLPVVASNGSLILHGGYAGATFRY